MEMVPCCWHLGKNVDTSPAQRKNDDDHPFVGTFQDLANQLGM